MSQPKVRANARLEHAPKRMSSGPSPMGASAVEKAADFRVSARRLLGTLRPQRARIAVAIAFGVVSTALMVVGPKVLGLATDLLLAGFIGKRLPSGMTKNQVIAQAQASGDDRLSDMLTRLDFVPGQGIDFAAVGSILLLVMALYVLSGLLNYAQAFVLNQAVQNTIYRIRQYVSAKLERLPLAYFDATARGEVLSRVTNDIDNVSQTLQQTFSQLVNSFLLVVGVIGMMLWISPTLALVAIIAVPVTGFLVSRIMRRSQRLFKQTWEATGELSAHVEEAFTGQTLVKVFGQQDEAQAEFDSRNERLYRAAFGSQFISGIIMPVSFMVGNLSYVITAVLGGLKVATGQLNIGDVQAFIQYSRQFSQPLTQIASSLNLLQSGVASAERVFELLDESEMTPDRPGELPAIRGRVCFNDVTFSYTDEPLIENLSFTAEPGQSIAIVGPTGAGKTTLVNLLMRFYDLDAGRILIDDRDISSVPRGEVRQQIGMVLQDTWLFHGTIHDNIAYGRPEAGEDEILAAAKLAFVDRFVHSLPDGYDTVINEEASNLSAGERQLVTIARAFLTDPSLLILDEATSSVDTRTEALIQRAMIRLRRGRTSFIIAHRLSTIRDADVILVMTEGKITEQGSHEELLANQGAYWQLHQAALA